MELDLNILRPEERVSLQLRLLYEKAGFRQYHMGHFEEYGLYQENRRFLLTMDRVKDKNNRYFDCPKCHQTVRVPRGKGKIAITFKDEQELERIIALLDRLKA